MAIQSRRRAALTGIRGCPEQVHCCTFRLGGQGARLGFDAVGCATPTARHRVDIDGYANVKRWMGAINERPAVRRGLEVLADEVRRDTVVLRRGRSILFGARQVAQH